MSFKSVKRNNHISSENHICFLFTHNHIFANREKGKNKGQNYSHQFTENVNNVGTLVLEVISDFATHCLNDLSVFISSSISMFIKCAQPFKPYKMALVRLLL